MFKKRKIKKRPRDREREEERGLRDKGGEEKRGKIMKREEEDFGGRKEERSRKGRKDIQLTGKWRRKGERSMKNKQMHGET